MKYIKDFNRFSINERKSNELRVEKMVRQKIDSMSEKDKEAVKSELMKMSYKLGLSLEEIIDPYKVAKVLASKQDQIKIESDSFNESLGSWWDRFKNKFYSWLSKLGVVGIISSIITTAIGSGFQEEFADLADYAPNSVVNPNTAVVIGGIAFVISLTATLIGLNKNENDTKVK